LRPLSGADREAFLLELGSIIGLVTNYVIKLTKYEQDNKIPDIVVIEGTADLVPMTFPFADNSVIIKENGVWKWRVNQK